MAIVKKQRGVKWDALRLLRGVIVSYRRVARSCKIYNFRRNERLWRLSVRVVADAITSSIAYIRLWQVWQVVADALCHRKSPTDPRDIGAL